MTAAPGFDILMYHQVGPFLPMREHRATYCHVDRFRAHMAWLRRLGCHVCSLQEAWRDLQAGCLPPRTVVLTFDDGYENFRQYAWPVLQEHGWTASVYLIASAIGGRADWLRQAGHEAAPLLDWPAIRALRREGVHFGSHALHHVPLAALPPLRQRRELRVSRLRLEDGLGEAVTEICYPYGSHDRVTLEAAAEVGYRFGVTCVRARVRSGWDPLALPRKAVSYGDSVLGVAWKLLFKNEPKHAVVMRAGFASVAAA